jgi:hypothetical protein
LASRRLSGNSAGSIEPAQPGSGLGERQKEATTILEDDDRGKVRSLTVPLSGPGSVGR